LSGRKLKLGQWDNPTGTYRVGIKAAYDFFPQDLVERLKGERKSAFDKKHRIAVDEVTKALEDTKLSATEKKGNKLLQFYFILVILQRSFQPHSTENRY
jgi:tripeptidyl-peptidase-2